MIAVSQVAEPEAETPAAPISADGQPEDSKPPPLAEDVLGPATAFAGEPAEVAAPSQTPPAPVSPTVAADITPEPTAPSSPQAPGPAFTPPTFSAPSIALPEFVPPNLPDFSDVSPAVLAVGGGALAAGVGAATYLAATKARSLSLAGPCSVLSGGSFKGHRFVLHK